MAAEVINQKKKKSLYFFFKKDYKKIKILI